MRFDRYRRGAKLLCAGVIGLLPQGAAFAAELIRVALPIAIDAPYAAVFAAEELGFYGEKNLKVEITAYRGAGAAQEAVVAGAADIVNLVPSGVAVAVSKGFKELIVGCGPQVMPDGWHMLVLPKSALKSAQDLQGKKVAISSKNSTTDFYALWTERHAKVKFETVPLGGSDWPALKGGQVDAIIRSSTQALRFLQSGEARSIVDFRAVMEPNIPECWVATEAILRSKQAAVRDFVGAVDRASKRLKEDETYAVGYLKKWMDEKSDAYIKLVYASVIRNLTSDSRVDMRALRNSLRLAELAGLTNLPAAEKLVADFAVAPGTSPR